MVKIIHIAKEETRLAALSHRQDSTYHGLCYTSRGALAETKNTKKLQIITSPTLKSACTRECSY